MSFWTILWRISQIPAVHHALLGAAGGLVPAAREDWRAFKTWQDWHVAAEYNWNTALWRWFQGALIGAVSATFLGSMLG